MRYIWLLIFAVFPASPESFPRVISVVDEENLSPVADVALLDTTGTMHIYTNLSGKADISSLRTIGTICFQNMTCDRIIVNGGVENIPDLCYRPCSSGIASPGRNFIVSLRLTI